MTTIADAIRELLDLTAHPDDLPLRQVRALLDLQPSLTEAAARVAAVAKSLPATPVSAASAPAAEPRVPTPVVVESVEDEIPDYNWTLRADDIEPGIVAYFDTNTVNTDDKITKPRWLVNRTNKKTSRPFLCVRADEDGTSCWLPFSSQYREGYLKVKPDWYINDVSAGRLGTGWLTGNYYLGPNRAFTIAAAQTEDPVLRIRRPRLTDAALQQVLDFARASGLTV